MHWYDLAISHSPVLLSKTLDLARILNYQSLYRRLFLFHAYLHENCHHHIIFRKLNIKICFHLRINAKFVIMKEQMLRFYVNICGVIH